MTDQTGKNDQTETNSSGPASTENPQATPTDGASVPTAENHSTGSQFYKQAIFMCNRAITVGLLNDAIQWAHQAEQIGALLETNNGHMPEIEAAYARIMLQACLRSQEKALITGNILPEHRQLADILQQATERLSARLLTSKETEPKVVALVAQGFVTRHQTKLGEFFGGTQSYRYSSSDDLDAMLESLASIQQCAERLCDDAQAQGQPFERKVHLAETAVSNARYSLSRLFSSFLSDWSKAEFFCKRAYLLLTTQPINEPQQPKPSGNAEVDRAVSALPSAYQALRRRSYKDSTAALKVVEAGLKGAAKS